MVKRCINREVPPAWVKTAWINCSLSKSTSRMIRGIKLLECWPEEIAGAIRVRLRGRWWARTWVVGAELCFSDEEKGGYLGRGASHRHMEISQGDASTGSVSSAPQVTSLWMSQLMALGIPGDSLRKRNCCPVQDPECQPVVQDGHKVANWSGISHPVHVHCHSSCQLIPWCDPADTH